MRTRQDLSVYVAHEKVCAKAPGQAREAPCETCGKWFHWRYTGYATDKAQWGLQRHLEQCSPDGEQLKQVTAQLQALAKRGLGRPRAAEQAQREPDAAEAFNLASDEDSADSGAELGAQYDVDWEQPGTAAAAGAARGQRHGQRRER